MSCGTGRFCKFHSFTSLPHPHHSARTRNSHLIPCFLRVQGYAADQGFEATETDQRDIHQRNRVIVFAGVWGRLIEVERGAIRTPSLREPAGEQGEGAGSAAVGYHPSGAACEVYGHDELRVVVG